MNNYDDDEVVSDDDVAFANQLVSESSMAALLSVSMQSLRVMTQEGIIDAMQTKDGNQYPLAKTLKSYISFYESKENTIL